MSKLPYYCRCNRREDQTLSLFGSGPVTFLPGLSKSTPDHSAMQQGWQQPIPSRRLAISGPTWYPLGPWRPDAQAIDPY